jgi:uroporphyrinogen decarboxylase
MISRERVIRTLNHQPIDRAPRDLWLGPSLESVRPDDVAEINLRFPEDFLHLDTSLHAGKRPKAHSQSPKDSTHTDGWGCVWKLESPDAAPTLIASPLAGASGLPTFRPPADLLDAHRFTKVNSICAGTGRFTLAAAELRPLERLCQLRCPETALRELAEGNVELRNLLDKLRELLLREIELWSKTQTDGVVLGDDLTWAAQSRGNLELWRSLLKPLFRECCKILHSHDKFAFFLAHGPLGEAIDDLIEIGVDAVHSQWSLEEFVKLAAARRGQIVFWGGVENRRLEPPAQSAAVRDAVFRVRKAADFGAGGIISQISWTTSISLRNVVTFFEQWLVPLPVAV